MLNRLACVYATHRKVSLISGGLVAITSLFLFTTYMQPRYLTTTQVAMFLNDEALIASQFKMQGLRPDETVLSRNVQDVRYVTNLKDEWGDVSLEASVSIFTASGGTQMLWTLTYDAGYHILRRWTGPAFMNKQAAALQARLQAFKTVINITPSSISNPDSISSPAVRLAPALTRRP
jgi:hypothetical protein